MSPQRTYIFTFLLSSRLFMHPYELMSKVCHLCMEQQRLGDPQADKVRATAAPPGGAVGTPLLALLSSVFTSRCLRFSEASQENHPEDPPAADGVDGDLPVRLQG